MATQKDRQKDHAWDNAQTIRGKNPDLYRKDVEGNTLYKHSYGKNTEMGWHIDHKKPLAKGGSEHLRNIQALQSTANIRKSDKYPHK